MLNIKGFFIILGLLVGVGLMGIVSFIYFLNVNDYSDWISKQVKQTTGYDVRFEAFENNWLEDSSLSITGLSLYQQQHRVLFIKQLAVKVDKLDLWQRQLEISHISLNGVEVDIQQPLTLSEKSVQASEITQQQITPLQRIAWERLHIKQFQITDLSATLKNERQQLLLTEAAVELNNLLIIEQKQLQTWPKNLDLSSNFKQLKFIDNQQQAILDNFQLLLNANLLTRQGELALSSESFYLESQKYSSIKAKALTLNLRLENNKLLLQEFMVHLFSGSVAINAQAQLAIKLLPSPAITIQQLVLNSLLVKDMQLNIPALPEFSSESQQTVKNEKLPIAELLIKKLKIENVDVFSESKQLPLQLKSVDAQINNLYVVQGYQLLEPAKLDEQSASFSLAFEYLRWQNRIVEQFSVAGSLQKHDPSWQLLKSFVTEK